MVTPDLELVVSDEENICRFEFQGKLNTHMTCVVDSSQGKVAGVIF